MPSGYERAVEVKIDGTVLSQDDYRIGNLRLHQPLYGHHEFEIEVLGTRVENALAASAGNSALNQLHGKIGAKVEITAGHGYLSANRTEVLAFEGLVTSVEAFTNVETGYAVRLRGHSPTIRLDDVPRNRIFTEIKASDWFAQAAGDRGLVLDVDSTTEVFGELVQRGRTDWDFARTILGQAGLHLYYDGKKLKAKKKIDGETITLGYSETGSALLEFAVHSRVRPGKLVENVWSENDPKQVLKQSSSAGKTTARATHPFTTNAEKASGSVYAVEGQAEPAIAVGTPSLLDADAGSYKGAWLASLSEATGRSDNAALAPGKIVEIAGLGGTLGGRFVLTSVTHEWVDERLVYANSFACVPESSAAPPRELRTAKDHEIWTARVTALKDPQSLGRVQVKFLNFEQTKWARLASFYLGESGGFVCYPEIGDEVIVGFADGDPRYPVILGSVLHPRQLGAAQGIVAPGLADETNDHKVFRSRSGHRLEFLETKDKSKIEIATPGDEVLLRLDATKNAVKLEIVSQGDVSITAKKTCTVTAEEDVTVDTKGNATIKAEKDVVVQTKANLKMKATQNVTIEGMQIELKSAAGSVKASASGVDVKGPMIKLN